MVAGQDGVRRRFRGAARLKLLKKAAPTVICIVICVALLGERLIEIEWSGVTGALRAIPMTSLFAAFALAALSHVALSGYDILALRRIDRRIPWPRALKGGFAAGAFAQTLGFGALTGTMARLAIYRANGIGPGGAATITVLAATGFFVGLFLCLAALSLAAPAPAAKVTGAPEAFIRFAAFMAIAGVIALAWAGGTRRRSLKLGALKVTTPGLRWLTGSAVLATADLVPAAFCFMLLLPADVGIDTATLIVVFVAATGVGLLSGAPGAIGPFEAVVFMALPHAPVEPLIAAALAYRAVYFLPPFAAAATLVLSARASPETRILKDADLLERVDWTLDVGERPEGELALLGDKHIYMPANGQAFAMYGVAGRVWLMLGAPVGPRAEWPALIEGLEAEAKAAGAALAVYKATEDSMTFWRERGYRAWPLGEEGSLDPTTFTLEGAPRRELRRKVRQAEKAGVEVEFHEPTEAPYPEMAEVALLWAFEHEEREQGFSMGRWSRRFVRRHPVFTARVDGRLVGFLSLWVGGDGREWMIDLMRLSPEAPMGSMHALVAAAIAFSAESGAARFNLCMAPLSGLGSRTPQTLVSRLGDFVYRRFDRWHGLSGMRRFKDAFRPDWRTRWLVARDPLAGIEAMIAAHRLVNGVISPETAVSDRSPSLRLPPTIAEEWEDGDDPATLAAMLDRRSAA